MEATYFIKSLPFFSGLSHTDFQVLLDSAKIKTYPKKASIFAQSAPADRFFLIISGYVKLHQTTLEGNEVVLAVFTQGDSFGEAILVNGATYPHNAEALHETEIIEFPAEALKAAAGRNSGFSLRLMQSMTQQIEKLRLENEHLAVMTATERTACLVNQMCLSQEDPENHNHGHLNFLHDKHLAAVRLGMKPETFSRTLKELKQIGVNIIHNDIYIKDPEALEKLCCSNCSASPRCCPLAKNNLHQNKVSEKPDHEIHHSGIQKIVSYSKKQSPCQIKR